MKLHWSPKSPFVRKVMIVAHETTLADKIQLVRSVALMTKPNDDLMRDNPLSKIPTLVLDDGRTLFDSRVICEYLDGLHGGRQLFPQSGEERWQALRWNALGDGLLDILILWRNERERKPEQRMGVLLQAFELKVGNVLALLERESDAIASMPFGIAQVAIGCALGYMDFRFADLAWRVGHPRLDYWQAQFARRPSAQMTAPVDDR